MDFFLSAKDNRLAAFQMDSTNVVDRHLCEVLQGKSLQLEGLGSLTMQGQAAVTDRRLLTVSRPAKAVGTLRNPPNAGF